MFHSTLLIDTLGRVRGWFWFITDNFIGDAGKNAIQEAIESRGLSTEVTF